MLPLHLLLGMGLVLSLWVLALTALVKGVRPGLATVPALWGVAVLSLGFGQARLLPGSLHWMVALGIAY